MEIENLSVAVLVPCYNEEVTIAKVVSDFRAALPGATVYVYDNNSTDATCECAAQAGAVVRLEKRQGKGNVMRRMFADIEADVYVLVDGDDTYDAASAPKLVEVLCSEGLDMVNGRRDGGKVEAYRPGHRFGNRLLTGLVSMIFGNEFSDMLSGYRVFSRRFVKSFPALAMGFEIETELTVHALELRMPTAEVGTPYKERPEGSASKLRTFHDGFRILRTIMLLVRDERPFQFFSLIALFLFLFSLVVMVPVFLTYFQTGLVPRFPTVMLATGGGILGALSLFCGLILDTVTLSRREAKRMRYLAIASIHSLIRGA
ncbi:glycosyltransferase family 2 protein [Martelella sp. HB161492]|uniref:glycosyltransferase family 2 protein n=1 Tax=Martelella sp. HB161492 TaxID=2720726 RepID=UPI001590A790|nr:glycosyltransferase family 2 protein [Martelella sp. HB161492]